MAGLSRRASLAGVAATTALLATRPLSAQAKTTLKVIWMGWPEGQVKPLMDSFRAARPDVELQVETIPFVQIFQTLEVRLGARTPDPDIFICDSPLTASYAARGHLMDLTPHIDARRFTPSAIAAASWQGKIYSAPFGSSCPVLFYNKKLLREAGIPFPEPDVAKRWTWEQLVEAAKKLADPGKNQWGFSFEQQERPYMLLPLAQSLGGVALSPDGFKATGYVDSPAFVEAYGFMQKLYTEWKVSPPGLFDPNLPVEQFGNGKIAMLVAGTFNEATIKNKYPDIEFGVAPYPRFARGKAVTPTGAWHIGVNPRTRHPKEALAFIDHFMSHELQVLWFELRPYPPVLKSVWEKEAHRFETDMWRIVRYELEHTAVPRPATPGFREYEDILRTALRDITTGADVAKTLTAAAQRIDRELEKYKT
ncbi:MAG: sugar ABC transporter substrate-binding protein [Geminicoccaceae bacterium]|nr:sugar ABC transporter substrate-binding protein [Geminicoccaceae bacterium]